MDIGIERWSTDAEREQVVKTLLTGGQAAVVRVLEKMPRVGYLHYRRGDASVPSDVMRESLEYACEGTAENDERRLVLATAKPDSSLKVIEIRFAQNGIGEGRIAKGVGITISKDQRTIQLTAYKESQVCLRDVRKR